MNKRAREIVDTFCTQIIKCETDIEDMWEMRTAVMNQLKSMRNCAKLELYVKIVKSLFNTNELDRFFDYSKFQVSDYSDFLDIIWNHGDVIMNIEKDDICITRFNQFDLSEFLELVSFKLGDTDKPPKNSELTYYVEYVQDHPAAFRQLPRLVYLFYHPRRMKEYRERVALILCARKFGQSDFSIFPTDVVKIIAKLVWQGRFK